MIKIVLLFSWNGASDIFGQNYNNLYSSSKEVSDDFYSQCDQQFWDANINGKIRDIPGYLNRTAFMANSGDNLNHGHVLS